VPWLAEKLGLVRRNHVEHVNEFVLHAFRAEEVIAIFSERFGAKGTEPFLESAFEHGSLSFGHFNAQFALNEFTQKAEFPFRNLHMSDDQTMAGAVFFGLQSKPPPGILVYELIFRPNTMWGSSKLTDNIL
jgi:hypothetical protein